ncbi:MAG: hypothetical protein Q9163_001523 [Psora crenata]
MSNQGITQMEFEASQAEPPLPPIDNVHDPPASLRSVAGPLESAIQDRAPLAAPQALPSASIPTVAPRTATPSRPVNGVTESTTPMPAKAASHGAPARRYLNERVTGVLLEGMKRLAAEQ